ncbi:MAG TPA: sugar ABC transporter substrate-binding protein [Chloroflexota bacterium]|jgi:multiple sugar transport system substrate-binding protein|nr:sugar ABC transporter substrate-binding protein [Chloroflexota bacterium]
MSDLSRRSLLRGALASAAVLLAACAPAPAPTATPAPKTAEKPTEAAKPAAAAPAKAGAGKLVFVTQSGKLSEDRYNPILAKWKEKNPSVDVEVIWAGASAAELQQKTLTLIAGGTPGDVFWTHTYTNAGLAKRKVPANLLDFTKNDSSLKLDDFFSAAVKDFEQAGGQYAIPRETTSTILCYNKKIFDDAGVKYPTSDWSWDDFTETAKKLTRGEGADKIYGSAGFQQTGFSWYTLIRAWHEGGDIVNAERNKYTLNEPPGVRAVQWIQDLVHTHKAHATSVDLSAQGADVVFASGKVGMILNISVYSAFNNAPFDWDIQHLPKKDKQITRNASAGHSMFSGSKQQDQAWELIKHVSSKESFEHLAATGLQLATLKSVAEKALDASSGKPPKNAKIGLDALGYARPEPVTGDWIAVHRELTTAMEGILGPNKRPVKDTLDGIAGRINEAIAAG